MKTLLTTALVLIAIASFSQKKEVYQDDIYFTPADSIGVQKSNIERYVKSRQLGYTFSAVSVGFAGLAVVQDQPEMLYISGAFAIISYASFLTGNKWLKKHAIEISNKGLVVRF